MHYLVAGRIKRSPQLSCNSERVAPGEGWLWGWEQSSVLLSNFFIFSVIHFRPLFLTEVQVSVRHDDKVIAYISTACHGN